ncbi:uncharacterized protein LOC143750144 isoform X1 [Siphateles boraxobius]|uniref:uncharacterized protein LOC143750144 isoform X1 n=1 Tax=Siphateles boraxobius TaxID=180520 RepID=UPI004063C4C3
MRTGIPIMLFVVVAGFHNAISASLEFDDSNKSPEEKMYEENVTTTQPDESEYAAAHVNVTEDLIKTTHIDGETEALAFDTDGETKALTVDTGEKSGSDESVGTCGNPFVTTRGRQSSCYFLEHSKQVEKTVKSTEDLIEEDYEEC